jgi:AraC family transcriptional activator of pobA
MLETAGLLSQLKHHDKLSVGVNENCTIPLPESVLQKLFQPHRLSFYHFVYMVQGSATYRADLQDITIANGQVVFGLPNQIFTNPLPNEDHHHYNLVFDENTLTLLPRPFPFLLNPLNSNTITFDGATNQRVQTVFALLYKLLHAPGKQNNVDIILAHVNTLLTELNSAYFQHSPLEVSSATKLSKYIEFKLAVETHLTEQQEVHLIAEKLALASRSLYGIVKEFSGLSPKEWMTNRLMLEAQRKLQYSPVSVKELAYELGFNDPSYFSRLFKKSTGKSVSAFLANRRDLSGN